MKSARLALQEAYSTFLTTPENLDFAKPDREYQMMSRVKNGVIYGRRGTDDEGLVIDTPRPQCHGSETFTGRTSTTHRCAVLAWNAPILAAAENQILVNSTWLRFAYDPYLDTNTMVRNGFRARLIELIFGIWCFSPRRRQVPMDMPARLIRLVDWMIMDTAARFRSQQPMNVRRQDGSVGPADPDDFSRALGFESARHAHWARSWQPHANDLYGILNAIDREALRPVTAVLYERENRREAAGENSVR